MRPARSSTRCRRRGITLIEMIIASVLASLLGYLMAMACATFGRPALEVEARARIAREGILAAQSLACDLGGFLADTPGRTGTLAQYPLMSWDLSNGNALLLNYQGASPGNVIVITYQLQGNLLVRTNSSTGATTTVAGYVTAFSVAPNPGNSSQALIQITIAFRYFTATYTLIGVSPS
jgi:type II secretory pathway component PulJ